MLWIEVAQDKGQYTIKSGDFLEVNHYLFPKYDPPHGCSALVLRLACNLDRRTMSAVSYCLFNITVATFKVWRLLSPS
jgi:hypothetical protein